MKRQAEREGQTSTQSHHRVSLASPFLCNCPRNPQVLYQDSSEWLLIGQAWSHAIP
jgi:hypothetical protein